MWISLAVLYIRLNYSVGSVRKTTFTWSAFFPHFVGLSMGWFNMKSTGVIKTLMSHWTKSFIPMWGTIAFVKIQYFTITTIRKTVRIYIFSDLTTIERSDIKTLCPNQSVRPWEHIENLYNLFCIVRHLVCAFVGVFDLIGSCSRVTSIMFKQSDTFYFII